jgi:spore coat protein A
LKAKREWAALALWAWGGVLGAGTLGPLGAGTLGPLGASAVAATASPGPTPEPSPKLKPFVDALPIPPVIHAGKNGVLEIHQRQARHRFHRDLPEALIWGYEGQTPGPTIEAWQGQAIRVLWHNELPPKALFPFKGNSVLPGYCGSLPPVRTVVHLHGAAVPEDRYFDPAHNSDGYPDAWSLPGATQEADYPNIQPAACLWYHDHAMGITARNVYAGLEGFYLLRDDYEKSLKLPSGPFEIPLMLQARSFHRDGSAAYTAAIASDEVYSDVCTVNGKAWPYLDLEPRRYRFRFLNASTSRTFSMRLAEASGAAGPAFYQIGSDGGFLEDTAVLNAPSDPLAPRLVLAPGERADVIIDFSKLAGKKFILSNDSLTDERANEQPLPLVMQMRVRRRLSATDLSVIPMKLRPIQRLDPSQASATRNIFLREETLANGGILMLLNGMRWNEPVTESPLAGSVEVWNLVNATRELHPFHIHQVQFQVLGRQNLDSDAYKRSGTVVTFGAPMPPGPGEAGWKDTIRVPPRMLTTIIMRFGPYAGRYVYHCHILEHEDMDMMRPFDVIAAK